MKEPNAKFYKQDENGEWWYYPGRDRPRSRAREKVCEGCDESYLTSQYHATSSRYCGRACAGRAVGRARGQGPASIAWKGGKTNRRGYVLVYRPDHHSIGSHTERKYVPEHRLVMEEALGRPLLRSELVHHKNGVKDDNRPENLELISAEEHNKLHHIGIASAEPPHCPSCRCGRHLRVSVLTKELAA